MSRYLFYPGCSIQRSARPYLDSTNAIRADIGLELEDVQDWNCCGATEYQSVHKVASYALIGRNLALATRQVNGTNTLAAACSACYLNLLKTDQYMAEDDRLNADVNTALSAGGLHYDPGTLEVRHLLDIVYNDIGLEAIQAKVTHPLTGLRVAPYYGCMIVRPDLDKRFDSTEYPHELDEILAALGATVIDFPLKTHCCGGHMTQISPEVAYEMIRRLVAAGDHYRADVMVTLCPMCQLNLDAYQGDMNNHFKTDYHVPVLYFTQLMGLAFGHDPLELGLGKEFVSAREALARIGVELPEEEPVAPKAAARKKDDPSLPMPQPLDGGPKSEEKGS
jgi:heterodisulfide reductase subunit B2